VEILKAVANINLKYKNPSFIFTSYIYKYNHNILIKYFEM